QLSRTSGASREEPPAVRAESSGKRVDLPAVRDLAAHLTACAVPQDHQPLLVDTREQASVQWAERHDANGSFVPAQLMDLPPAGRVPDPHVLPIAASGRHTAVGAEGDGVDSLGWTLQLVNEGARRSVPYARAPVESCCQGQAAIGAKGHALDSHF